MKKLLGAAATAVICWNGPVQADPSLGFGISFVFGGDVALGIRVFSNDQSDRGALALGLDYKIQSQSFRPTIGAAWINKDYYVDFSLGYDLNSEALDYGIGAGLTSNVNAPATATPAPPPPPPADPPTDL